MHIDGAKLACYSFNNKLPASILSGWADAIGLLVDLKVAADEEMRQRVRDTGGYADVMVVSDASGIETATAIMVWDDRPFATVTPYSDDYFVQTF